MAGFAAGADFIDSASAVLYPDKVLDLGVRVEKGCWKHSPEIMYHYC